MKLNSSDRKIWIDWFKVLGMVLIIWGHMFPYHFTDFVYSFSVPAFFWASGYLTKVEKENRIFFHKLWRSLMVPYLLISTVNLVACVTIFHHHYLNVVGVLKSLMAIPLGIQSFPDNSAIGIGALWFVYTLGVIKVLQHFTSRKFMMVLSVLCLILVLVLHPRNCYLAFVSSCLCLPFYTLGTCCQGFDISQSLFTKKTWIPIFSFASIAVIIIALWYLSPINQAPYLYKLEYGRNIFLMLLNASLGILLLFLISKRLECLLGGGNLLAVINSGMILVLGFQRWFVLIVTYIVKPRIVSHFVFDILSLMFSVLILFIFIPLIIATSRYIPAFIGFRKIKNHE